MIPQGLCTIFRGSRLGLPPGPGQDPQGLCTISPRSPPDNLPGTPPGIEQYSARPPSSLAARQRGSRGAGQPGTKSCRIPKAPPRDRPRMPPGMCRHSTKTLHDSTRQSPNNDTRKWPKSPQRAWREFPPKTDKDFARLPEAIVQQWHQELTMIPQGLCTIFRGSRLRLPPGLGQDPQGPCTISPRSFPGNLPGTPPGIEQ